MSGGAIGTGSSARAAGSPASRRKLTNVPGVDVTSITAPSSPAR